MHRWNTVYCEELPPGGDHVGRGEGITGHSEVTVLVLILSNYDPASVLQRNLIQRKLGERLHNDIHKVSLYIYCTLMLCVAIKV